jgi:phosphate transport system permease protein
MLADGQARLARRRRLVDRLATIAARGAGGMVLGAILLILVYLVMICLPLAAPADVDEQREISLDPASVFAFRDTDGSLWRLPRPQGDALTTPAAVVTSGSRALVAAADGLHVYDLVRLLDIGTMPERLQPDARWRLRVDAPAEARSLAFDSNASDALIAFIDAERRLTVVSLGFSGDGPVRERRWTREAGLPPDGHLLLDAVAQRLLFVSGDRFLRWDLPGPQEGDPTVVGGQLPGLGAAVSAVAWGPGLETLLLATVDGELHRFDVARRSLPRLGEPMNLGEVAAWMDSERSRRVTALLTRRGDLLLMVPSTGEVLLRTQLDGLPAGQTLSLSADGAYLYSMARGKGLLWPLRSGSPNTGWRSLWLPQRYGAYDEPVHSWHPEGAAIGVLPKYGLTPLLWGTFKAALYGMLIAVPLALGAAIYTGYFLPTRRRNQVKPMIEMLEAFPTVVLGFIAGLWLAPLLSEHLFAVLLALLLLVVLPLLLAGAHLLLQHGDRRFVRRPPRLAAVLLAYALGSVALVAWAGELEAVLFDAPLRTWLWDELGIRYDQRNALLVGLAMGLAITPVMFSVIEDAINAVPRSLSDGSLALGATRWQSLAGVVLPAASPAILSALLIGFARGLGETMIVLLATGNTPLLEADPFSGLRSLAATIAAELPEADAGSVHFRLLFLGALVLFALTSVLNTIAELFRQRLRYAYAGR